MPKAKKAVEVMQEDEVKTDLEKRRLFHEFNEEDLNALNEKIAELTEKKEKFADESKTMASIAKGAENEIKKLHGDLIVVHAQVRIRPFYEKQGYIQFGQIDDDEGVPHVWMKKKIQY